MSPPSDDQDDLPSSQNPNVFQSVWHNNKDKGALLILISEMFGSSTDAIVRFLQQGGHGMHPFQVIFARMIITLILSLLYMWWTEVPQPFGDRSVRHWLVLRAVFGFMGIFCLYYSVHYLPLAEATVFRFLVPIVTAFACSLFLGTPFTRTEFLAGCLALIGVIMIAHPKSIFGSVDDSIDTGNGRDPDDVSPSQRLFAIIVAFLGMFGASGAYTTIRLIGDKAHALVSVSYFAALGAVGSTLALVLVPGISFTVPHGPREWVLLALLGLFGFSLQFLLTAGLQLDRTSKATSMMYTQILFALGFDWGIWGVLPGGWSLVGGAIVIGATFWCAVQKSGGEVKEGKGKGVDEESALLGGGEEVVVRRGSISA